MDIHDKLPDWAMGMNCAVTVCDKHCKIIYMNKRSRDTFAGGTDSLIGSNLLECHSDRSKEIIHYLLSEGGTNCYTIEKNGLHKMIFQTAWKDEDGNIGGLVELSMVVPTDMPHYVRS